MLNPLYSFSLNQPITEKLVILSKLDGRRPSLICCTVGGKVFVHSPHEGPLEGNVGNEIKFLNINKNICAITSGVFDPEDNKEILVVASQNTLIAYNVEKNSDLFYKEIPDGINTLSFGYVKSIPKPLLLVGGNCSIQGFDQYAEEQYWTVTGDNVSAICFCDIDEDGIPELLVGSDDFAIRAFRNEDIIFEVTEAARISHLVPIKEGYYAYALDNGTLGVYKQKHRQWRVKAKHRVISIVEMFTQGEQPTHSLIIGWSNGRVEVRSDTSGEVLYKTTLNQPIAKILKGDYRMDDTIQIIVVTVDGHVRGYSFDYNMRGMSEKSAAVSAASSNTGSKQLETLYNDLIKKKNELLIEASALAENKKAPKTKSSAEGSIVPPGTQLLTYFRHNVPKKYTELVVQTNSSAIVKSLIIFAEQIFANESETNTPKNPSNTISFPLTSSKNVTVNLNIKALVGASGNSSQYQVFEIQKKLPKFYSYMYVNNLGQFGVQPPSSTLTFYIKERIPRFVRWISQSFIIDEKVLEHLEKETSTLNVAFLNLYDGKPLIFDINTQNEGKVVISTDSMEATGDIIQDICSFMNITDIESYANFPRESEELKQLIKNVNDFNEVRLHLAADMAEAIRNAKVFVVKAEDARILGDMRIMKKMYSNLYIENRNLVGELMKRNKNHEALLASLKQINNMISKASNLRYGAPKTKVVSLCRAAIKNNNIYSLIQIIQTGKES